MHYSQNQKKEYLLLDRKAKCLFELGRIKLANSSFNLALEAIDNCEVIDQVKEVFKQQVQNSIEKLKDCNDEKPRNETKESTLFEVKNSSNQFLGLSAKAKVEFAGEKFGRRLIAEKDIQPGN